MHSLAVLLENLQPRIFTEAADAADVYSIICFAASNSEEPLREDQDEQAI